MVTLTFNNAGKRFTPGWVFRRLQACLGEGDRVAVTGFNGSGKSTLLRVVAGMLNPEEGSVTLENEKGRVDSRNHYQHISFAAPYIDLIEEFSAMELLRFYSKFKEPGESSAQSMARQAGLDLSTGMKIKDFSSGMKQRLKLILALSYRSDLLLLDEPASNLDQAGLEWLDGAIGAIEKGIVLIATNDPDREARQCNKTLCLEDFKQA